MWRRILFGLLLVVAGLAIVFVLGPRVPVEASVTFDPSAIGSDPAAYLAKSESAVPDIRDGLEKEIVWAYPASRAKTPLSIVYIHGFSASKGEIRPMTDKVAGALGANIYYARLTGHGRDGAAMATASVNDWINDMAEAMAIGRTIGEKIIIMGTSTGAGLATFSAVQDGLLEGVAAMVLISPNYAVQAAGSEILTMPWGEHLANMIVGPERGFTPENELHGRFWTSRYPTKSLLPMAALTAGARDSAVEKISIPALFVFSEGDKVVRHDVTREIAGRWGGPTELVIVENTDDPYSHVLAGDALSPSTTDMLAERTTAWIKSMAD